MHYIDLHIFDCTLPLARAARRYTSQFFGLAGAGAGNHSHTLAELERKGAQFCRTPWAVLASRHSGEYGLQDYCFSAAFISALLRRGLSFPTSAVTIGAVEPHRAAIQRRQRNVTASGVAVFVSNSIDGAKIDWAIGAFIKYHAEAAGDWAAHGRAYALPAKGAYILCTYEYRYISCESCSQF